MRTGWANAPLHGGHCPRWLFERMQRLAAAMVEVMAGEFGPGEVLRRLADPVWFQAFGCVLGFDWHSSGLTTVVCGALKEGLRSKERDTGLYLAGGKGAASRKTPHEIAEAVARGGLPADAASLQFASRMAAKVDNAAVQDGYQIYHHFFAFTADGTWTVVQQGMNEEAGYARRYHWLSQGVKDFVVEPHAGVCGGGARAVLNLVDGASEPVRQASVGLACEPREVLRVLRELGQGRYVRALHLPRAHPVPDAARLDRLLYRVYESAPRTYADLVATRGVGASTLRALAMVAEVVYGARPSFRDPVRYSFAHGGKDGHPRPIDRAAYETSIAVLEEALRRARLGRSDRLAALRRLAGLQRSKTRASGAPARPAPPTG